MRCPNCNAHDWDEIQHSDPEVVAAFCRQCELRVEFHQHRMTPCGEQFDLFDALKSETAD